MGMYDIVLVRCPKCNRISEFQSKGGDCILASYRLENCPDDVLSNINRHAPNTCDSCKCVFDVDIENRKSRSI